MINCEPVTIKPVCWSTKATLLPVYPEGLGLIEPGPLKMHLYPEKCQPYGEDQLFKPIKIDQM
jgi:hypothetical protein